MINSQFHWQRSAAAAPERWNEWRRARAKRGPARGDVINNNMVNNHMAKRQNPKVTKNSDYATVISSQGQRTIDVVSSDRGGRNQGR